MHIEQEDEDLLVRARLEAEENIFNLKSGFGDTPAIDETDPVLKGIKEKVYPALGFDSTETENEEKKKTVIQKKDKTGS